MGIELSQSVEQKQQLVNKINILNFILQQLKSIEVKKDNTTKIDEINDKVLKVSEHKAKLVDELTRLCGVETKTELKVTK